MRNFRKIFLITVSLLLCNIPFSQSFKIGSIDIYGNRKISSNIILSHLLFKEGDSINHESFKPENVAAALEQVPGVKHATVNPICCDTANHIMLYIGIGETDSVISKHRAAPKQNIQLPNEMITAYRNLNNEVEAAVLKGQATEDDSKGYALFNYPPARKEQLKFIDFATHNLVLLENVLKNSGDAEHRAAAAEIIPYFSDTKKVVDQLLYAVDDADETVRNNATRALGILAGYLEMHPELRISIPADPFIKMVNSIVWTDRNKGASVLMHLTDKRDPGMLKQIKQQAMPSIIEMAKWKDRGHAAFCFVILGRIAGEDEASLFTKNYSKEWAAEVEEMVKKCLR
jgi:hypothetical protein